MEPASLRQGYHLTSKNKFKSNGVTREFFENLDSSNTTLNSSPAKKCQPGKVEKFLDSLIDRYQQVMREIKELEENLIVNGNATTSAIAGNPNGTEYNGIVQTMAYTQWVFAR